MLTPCAAGVRLDPLVDLHVPEGVVHADQTPVAVQVSRGPRLSDAGLEAPAQRVQVGPPPPAPHHHTRQSRLAGTGGEGGEDSVNWLYRRGGVNWL